MRVLTPAAVLALVTGWIFAQGLDRPMVAAVVAALSVGAACADAMRRRAPAILPVAGLVAILAVLAGAIALLLSLAPAGPTRLVIQLSMVAVLAPVIPIFYAFTFGAEDADE